MNNADFLQSILTIGAFLLVIILVSILIRRFVAERKIGEFGFKFKIVSKLPLNSKSQLFIVQIGERYLLIGASEQSVSALADLTKIVLERRTTAQPQTSEIVQAGNPANPINFKEFIRETFKKSKN